MERYKLNFIDFLLQSGALKIGGDFKLKSGRISPYFVNMGMKDGVSIARLGDVYAEHIVAMGIPFDVL